MQQSIRSVRQSNADNDTHVRGWKAQRAFWSSWLRSPISVGAIAPSSAFLARSIAAQIDPHHPGWVVELGAGSGVITRALLHAGVKPERLLVVERDRRMCKLLKHSFPEAHVVHGDAQELEELLAKHHVHKINTIVSCLPLLIFPKPVYTRIVEQMLAALTPYSRLIQFTYGARSSIRKRMLARAHVAATHRQRVWLNVPPATIWIYEKK